MNAQAGILTARLHAPFRLELAAESPQPARPGDAWIRVSAVGICGSDRHWYEEGSIGDAVPSRPLVLGHEFAGVIVDGPRAGERVVADPAIACGACEHCKAGRSNVCPDVSFAGHSLTDGALREEMPWPERLLVSVPEQVGDLEAPLLEPLGVCVNALELAASRGRVGSAGVLGCGPLGLLLIGLLRATGVGRIVATDRLAHRLEAARAMGATSVHQAEGGTRSGQADDARLDVCFEAAGDDGALADAIAAVRPGGTVVLIGIPARDVTSFPAASARRKGLALLMCRRMLPEHLARAIELAATGWVPLAPLVTHCYRLTDVGQAFATLMARDGLKVVVTPH